MLTAEQLLVELHGKALRLVCHHAQCHYNGLAQAARHPGLRSFTKLRRQMRELDSTCAFLRHVSAPRCQQMLADLEQALQAVGDGHMTDGDDAEASSGHDGDSLGSSHEGQREAECDDDTCCDVAAAAEFFIGDAVQDVAIQTDQDNVCEEVQTDMKLLGWDLSAVVLDEQEAAKGVRTPLRACASPYTPASSMMGVNDGPEIDLDDTVWPNDLEKERFASMEQERQAIEDEFCFCAANGYSARDSFNDVISACEKGTSEDEISFNDAISACEKGASGLMVFDDFFDSLGAMRRRIKDKEIQDVNGTEVVASNGHEQCAAPNARAATSNGHEQLANPFEAMD